MYFTKWAFDGLITSIQCCGGHGFQNYSGISQLSQNILPNTILEGENTVLAIQVGKFLLKCQNYFDKGKKNKIVGHCSYFKNQDVLKTFRAYPSETWIRQGENLLKLLQKASVLRTSAAKRKLVKYAKKMHFKKASNEKTGIDFVEAAQLHTYAFTYQLFLKDIQKVSSANARKALERLGLLYAIQGIQIHAGKLVSLEVVDGKFLSAVKEVYESLLDEIYPDCLALIEGSMFHQD